ncbi:MAG: flavodoxin [Fusobacteriaceae bacterium]|jgi:flavodoxin I|nr:flavodoxin [Fusobacteriaceae bacterium]
MKKIGVFYGSTGGKSAACAEEIEFYLRKEDCGLYDVAQGVSAMGEYENLIFVAPTYGVGELQTDWEAVREALEAMNFHGKTVALAGLGNQYAFGESYLGAMRTLYDLVAARGAKVVGTTDTAGYKYEESPAVLNGRFVGLALDEENQPGLTPDRIKNWILSVLPMFEEIKG